MIRSRLAPRCSAVYALMAGTVQLSRALTDRQPAEDLLEQGIRNALAVLDGESAASKK